MKIETIDFILSILSSFDKNIQFFFKEETRGILPISDMYSEPSQMSKMDH